MALDPSILLQGRTPEIDFAGSFDKGMRIGEMSKERTQKALMSDLYKKNTTVDQTGKPILNKGGFLKDLAASNPQAALETQKKFAQDDADKQNMEFDIIKKHAEVAKQLTWSVSDQASWTAMKQKSLQLGLPNADKLPDQFDPGLLKQMQMQTLTAGEQIAKMQQERDDKFRNDGRDLEKQKFGIEQGWKKKEFDLKEQELGAKHVEKTVKQQELSSTEAKQRGLYELGAKAEQQYRTAVADKDEYDPTGVGQLIDNADGDAWYSPPNFMKNDKAIEAKAAQANWIEAYLRDASGAAIPPSERGAYAKDFFPQPGDTDTVVANKQALREQKMENARVGSGPSTQMANFTPTKSKGRSGFIPEAQAGGGSFDGLLKAAPQMQDKDLEAFKWASQNKENPQAEKILMNLNGKYGQ